MKILIHFLIIVVLSVVSQVGGLIYLLVILTLRPKKRKKTKKVATFLLLYLIATFFVIPYLAPVFGREKIKESNLISANTFLTKLLNRNYVRPELNNALGKIAKALNQKHKGVKLIYLDANFPFIDKFPLLPHLSHNDGKKLDISLVYQEKNGILSNKKPSNSGYGVFEKPKAGEYRQTEICKKKGYWQYDFTKYVTFGKINEEIEFSQVATRTLIIEILKQQQIGKLFIEPHLKKRLNLTNPKIRFHGCQAVRHDDHIHIQLR